MNFEHKLTISEEDEMDDQWSQISFKLNGTVDGPHLTIHISTRGPELDFHMYGEDARELKKWLDIYLPE